MLPVADAILVPRCTCGLLLEGGGAGRCFAAAGNIMMVLGLCSCCSSHLSLPRVDTCLSWGGLSHDDMMSGPTCNSIQTTHSVLCRVVGEETNKGWIIKWGAMLHLHSQDYGQSLTTHCCCCCRIV
jgi:hypothetical protein